MGKSTVLKKVLETINENGLLESGENVLVGVSGGPDSVCLLHALQVLSGELGINLYAVHVNHMLRGKESDGDEQYVRDFCAGLNIRLFVRGINVAEMSSQKGMSLEEAGREARYACFYSILKDMGGAKIAVAHNRNDQAETVMMRIIRGTGLEGLKGMEYKRDQIIRPLLDVSRAEIEAYCSENNLGARVDSSNLQNVYTRNRIRLELIPYITSHFNEDLVETLCRMAVLLKADNNYIEGSANIIYNQCVQKRKDGEVELATGRFRDLHPAIGRRVVRSAIKEVKGDLKGIDSLHVEKVLELVFGGRTGAEIHLPGGICAGKSYKGLRIFKSQAKGEKRDYLYPLAIPGETFIEEGGFVLRADVIRPDNSDVLVPMIYNKPDSFTQFFDYEKFKTGINIRNRRNGDVFKPLRSNGTKKLKEYLIDNKIPKEERAEIPLIAADKEIVWIVGHKISDKFKVSENTKNVLRLMYENLSR